MTSIIDKVIKEKEARKKQSDPQHNQKLKEFYNNPQVVNALSKRRSLKQLFKKEISTHATVNPKKVAKKITPFIKGKILNIGIGAGPMTKELSKKGQVYGIDISKPLLQKAKKRGAIPIQASAEQLPLKANSFDSAVCVGTLGHIQKPEKALQELHRTLKPNAPVVISVYKNTYRAEESSKRIQKKGAPKFKNYSEKEIKKLMEKNGFKIIKMETEQVIPGFPKKTELIKEGFISEIYVYAVKK